MNIDRIAETLDVSVSSVRRALREGLDLLGDESLEIHGELRGRGFVARRKSARRGEPWTFAIETPHQIARESTAWTDLVAQVPAEDAARMAQLEALVRELTDRLGQAEAEARAERDRRMRLEGQVEVLEQRWLQLEALLAEITTGRGGQTEVAIQPVASGR